MKGIIMEYVKKICPICRNGVLILDTVNRTDVYCTLKCLSESFIEMSEIKN